MKIDRDRPARLPGARAAGVRRRARLFLRIVQPRQARRRSAWRRTSCRATCPVRRRGVLRGLHYQWPKPQGKLVSVLEGEVWDVAVDIRRGSPDFGRWTAVGAQRGQQAPFLDSGRLRARLRRAERARAVHLPVHRDLRPRRRCRHPLGRSAAGDRLAGERAAAVGQGRQRAVARRRRAGAPAGLRRHEDPAVRRQRPARHRTAPQRLRRSANSWSPRATAHGRRRRRARPRISTHRRRCRR